MFTVAFLKATFERAFKTFCQSAVATIVAGQVTGLFDLDFATVGSVACLATLLSVLTSYGSGAVSSTPGPSLGGETTPTA